MFPLGVVDLEVGAGSVHKRCEVWAPRVPPPLARVLGGPCARLVNDLCKRLEPLVDAILVQQVVRAGLEGQLRSVKKQAQLTRVDDCSSCTMLDHTFSSVSRFSSARSG
jgi:hypothetical protein